MNDEEEWKKEIEQLAGNQFRMVNFVAFRAFPAKISTSVEVKVNLD